MAGGAPGGLDGAFSDGGTPGMAELMFQYAGTQAQEAREERDVNRHDVGSSEAKDAAEDMSDRRKAGLGSLEKFLDTMRGMNPSL